MKWWYEYNDIDQYFDFFYSETEPTPAGGMIRGPFRTFAQAKKYLISEFQMDIRELKHSILMVKSFRAKQIKDRS